MTASNRRVDQVRTVVRRSCRGLVVESLAWSVLGVGVLSFAVRLTVRDRLPIVDLLYYATPFFVQAALFAVATSLWVLARRTGRAVAAGLVAGSVLVLGLLAGHESFPCTTPAGARRVVFWNAARTAGGLESVATVLGGQDADIIGLVEGRRPEGGSEAIYRRLFPGHTVHDLSGGLILLTRWEVEWVRYFRFGTKSRAAEVRLAGPDGPLELVLVDVEADLSSRRAPLLERVTRIAAGDGDAPRIVLGDFNTPRDATAFAHLRLSFDHAFETAGNGFHATWPRRLPLIAIDHVWLSRGLVAACARNRFHPASDHAMLTVDFLIPAATSAGPRSPGLRSDCRSSTRPGAPRRSAG